MKLSQLGAAFRHLHQGIGPLHHAGAATHGYDDESAAKLPCTVNRPGDFFTDNGSHASTDEPEIHDGDGDCLPVDFPHPASHGIVQIGLVDRGLDAVRIPLCIGEFQRIRRSHLAIVFREGALVEQQIQVVEAADTERCFAVDAGERCRLQLLDVHHFAAGFAFQPRAVGRVAFRCRRCYTAFVAFEPGQGYTPLRLSGMFRVAARTRPSIGAAFLLAVIEPAGACPKVRNAIGSGTPFLLSQL